MSNDVIGDLSKSRLFDLIKPLLDRKKSGMVLIKGRDSGELYVEGGSIMHARTGSSSGEEAILSMVEWNYGQVAFDWQAVVTEQTVYMPTEQLLTILVERENAWTRIREVIPSSQVTFQMPMDGDPGDMTISGVQWKILALCNRTRTVAEIADALKWQIFETSQAIYQMYQNGLLEKSAERRLEEKVQVKRTVNGNFFPLVEKELRKIMGAMAPIIIDDKIEDFGESRDAFPEERLQPFVQAVCEEISDKAKRSLFARSMTELVAQRQK